MKLVHSLAALAVLAPAVAHAQMSDTDYCNALGQKYQTYVANITTGRDPHPPTVQVQNAIEQCKTGNTAAAIPFLEQKLKDAKVDLPKRT
ncbi:MAG: hypothetical protein U1E23_08220 [Reyranellaceae bacterium]